MHDDHHHHHHHGHDHHHDHHHPHDHSHGHAAPGHNRNRDAVQWQTPHLPEDHHHHEPQREKDMDLVEKSFVEGFSAASDPTSFLRLSGIPFVGVAKDGTRYHLLRVEVSDRTDIGSIVPLLGGAGVRYDPLPSKLSSRRRQLAFMYHDGKQVLPLDFETARGLKDETDAAAFDVAKDN